jgi:predicted HicB family RNase H-like nuclease
MSAASTNGKPRMRATLIRFGPDVFEELQEEAGQSGVSVAQYVREAVVARMAYTAGRRGDQRYEAQSTNGR